MFRSFAATRQRRLSCLQKSSAIFVCLPLGKTTRATFATVVAFANNSDKVHRQLTDPDAKANIAFFYGKDVAEMESVMIAADYLEYNALTFSCAKWFFAKFVECGNPENIREMMGMSEQTHPSLTPEQKQNLLDNHRWVD